MNTTEILTDLERFHIAQRGVVPGLPRFEIPFNELQQGKKTSHWIWYIFPQLKCLGSSQNAQYYGIVDLHEACNYLRDPILFSNYQLMIDTVLSKLDSIPLLTLMNGKTDAYKFISSLTLFHAAATRLAKQEPGSSNYQHLISRAEAIFIQLKAQNFTRCHRTLSVLGIPSLPDSQHKNPSPQPKSPPSFFITKPAIQPPPARINLILSRQLQRYIDARENEWSYHYNFLGFTALLYFMQDLILGTDYFNSRHREVKVSAAKKLKRVVDERKSDIIFYYDEKNATDCGRLGKIVSAGGGLQRILDSNKQFDDCQKITGLGR